MSKEPVDVYLKILNLIPAQELEKSSQKLGVNQLFKKTGSLSKPDFLKVIKKLEKNLLIKLKKDPYHKQKKSVLITEIGKEILKTKELLDNYISSFDHLIKFYNELFELQKNNDDKIVKYKLKERGWEADEVIFYEDTYEGLNQITITSEKNIFDILISRYVFLITKYKLEGITIEIFDSFLLKIARYKLKMINISQGLESSENLAKYQNIVNSQLEEILRFLEPFPKIYYDYIKVHLITQISILNIPKEIIKKYLDEVNNNLKNKDVPGMSPYKYVSDALKEYLSAN